MWYPPFRSTERATLKLAAWRVALVLLLLPRQGHAQACCAGSGVVTPGRLALHETALVGVQLKAGLVTGSFDDRGNAARLSHGASELDLEQDLFGAVRLGEHAQFALLVPLLETRRESGSLSEFGGGIGDVNLNVRYDFTFAGASPVMPGLGVLAGVTVPSGTPADSSRIRPLATDATGIGAYQASLGLSVEQAFGPWLANLTGVVAQRTARTVTHGNVRIHERLAAQWSLLAALGYVFTNESALALSAAYTSEGDATINGTEAAGSKHRTTTLTLAGLQPLSDSWRIQAAIFDNPSLSGSSVNQPAIFGGSATVIHAWL